ncbi:Hint domain-containing protein [Rhodobacter maris]|uniref:Hint domain-containing protein n=1 Tax=Rhodobacter maris TaxID=446682 RepID=A0A285SJL3_9RHOB|nr:Hint domain-containing protein [Rhodobacter maris]SOC07550.1 Hint domain-containing protein [Rhodobacter maris]
MPFFGAWHLRDLILSGPDPFGSTGVANVDAVGASTFTLLPEARPYRVDLPRVDPSDGDALSKEADGRRGPATAKAFIGDACDPGAAGDVEIAFSYVIRPLGSADPADNVTLHALEAEGAVQGIASAGRLIAGQSYLIVAIETSDPAVPSNEMAVCFAAGTLIATRRGPKPVETLGPGDRIQTSDNGFAAVDWVGRWRVNGMGASAPVRISAGVLGNDRPLFLSGQHRVLLRPTAGPLAGEEVLVAAKTLVGLPGVARMPCPRIEWVHVLLPAHEVIFAENARAESLLLGQQAFRIMEPVQARGLRDALSDAPLLRLPARPIVPPVKVGRLILQHRAGLGPAQVAGLQRV